MIFEGTDKQCHSADLGSDQKTLICVILEDHDNLCILSLNFGGRI